MGNMSLFKIKLFRNLDPVDVEALTKLRSRYGFCIQGSALLASTSPNAETIVAFLLWPSHRRQGSSTQRMMGKTMGRIRTVKPELFKHEELFELELATGLPMRTAFIGMFTCCDREGRFKWRPRALKLEVLPYDELDFSRVLDALLTRDFVRKYAIGTEIYGVIPTWHLHQVINNRESESAIPSPTESSYISTTSTREARVVDATATPLVHAHGEGKGREGKGTGKEGNDPVADARGVLVERRSAVAEVIGDEAPLAIVVQQASKQRVDVGDDVRAVFTYWQKTLNHERAQLDAKRTKAIKARLKDGYSVADLCLAVDGCAKSPYHMGQNDSRAVYSDIELICRDGPKVDSFIKKAETQSGIDHGLQHQIDILKDWADKP